MHFVCYICIFGEYVCNSLLRAHTYTENTVRAAQMSLTYHLVPSAAHIAPQIVSTVPLPMATAHSLQYQPHPSAQTSQLLAGGLSICIQH